jgi:ribosomal protein S18 acetylase RimI-like enzyme
MEKEIKILEMTPQDIPFALSLTDHEKWGHQEVDFRRRIDLDPRGSFVAILNDEKVGIISSVMHGKYAFLGNLIIRDGFRGEGIGEQLMKHSIHYLLDKKTTSIELDGVLSAVSLYRRLGFRDKYLSMRFMRTPDNSNPPSTTMEKVNGKSIVAFDKRQTGLSRKNFLEGTMIDYPNCSFTIGNPISGYGMIKPRATGTYAIGPIIANDFRSAKILLNQILIKFGDKPLSIGVPEQNHKMSQLLVEKGFQYRQPSLRMFFGKRIDYEKHVYAILGPDVG